MPPAEPQAPRVDPDDVPSSEKLDTALDRVAAATEIVARSLVSRAPKPGWKTTEFWFAAAAAIAPWLAVAVPAPISATITAAVGAAYGITRAITKLRR